MPGSRNSGNRTARRGSRPRQRITLSRRSAHTLRTLLAQRNAWRDDDPMTEEQLIEGLIEAAWRELDAEYEAAAEQADIYGD